MKRLRYKAKCIYCRKIYKVQYKYELKYRKYCSRKCFEKQIKIIRKGKGNPMYGKPAWNKNQHIQTNTGRTHFKKGHSSWNKGLKGYHAGKNHPNWHGGIAKIGYSYKFNKRLKEQIRHRDNYKCQICGIKQKNYYRKLDVHHIDYDKKNLEETNLISLCNTCHMKTNYKRKYWKEYFEQF